MTLRARWLNQQCHSTEGWWLVNHVKGQSHQAQLTNARFYELGLTRELTNPRVGVIPEFILRLTFLCFNNIFYPGIN